MPLLPVTQADQSSLEGTWMLGLAEEKLIRSKKDTCLDFFVHFLSDAQPSNLSLQTPINYKKANKFIVNLMFMTAHTLA